MKALFLSFILVLASGLAFSQENIWTGNVSSTWDTPGNWSLGAVPGPATTVSIKKLTNKPYPVLTGNVEIAYLDMHNKGTGGSLYLGAYELKTVTVWVAGSNIYSNGGTIRTSMVRLCGGMNFYGNITLYTDNGVIGGYWGGNTWHGDLTVYASPKVPVGQTTSSCWPCGNLMFSYTYGDTFKGDFKLIKRSASSIGNVSNLGFGIFSTNTVFEKKAAFIDSSANGLNLGFSQYGGTVTFMDSALFSLNTTYVGLRGNVEFQKPVVFRQTGGNIDVSSWIDYSNNNAYMPTLVTFRKDILIDKTLGGIRLGDQYGTVVNRSVIDAGGGIRAYGAGFNGGTLELTNTTINAPNVEIIAATHPPVVGSETGIYFNNTLVNGTIKVKADNIRATNSVFNGETTLQKDGYAALPNSAGGNTFNKYVKLLNSAGYDWNFGNLYPDTYKDSVLISLSGTGQHQIAGSNRGAFFKVGMVDGNRFEGPVRIESETVHSGDVLIGNFGGAEFLSSVEINNFKSGNLTFYNSKFRGAELGRSMTTSSPGVRLLFKDNCLFEGPVSIKVSRFGSDYTTFMKPVVIWKTDEQNDDSIGGNVFHQRVQFKSSSSNGKIVLLSGEDKLIERIPQ